MLRDRRLELDLSQYQVAQLAGVRETDVSRWERGHVKSLPLYGTYLICKALGLDLYEVARALADDSEDEV